MIANTGRTRLPGVMQASSGMSIVDQMGDNVLVLGGGLAGAAAAHRLGDEGIPVTLVDRNDYH